MDFLGPISPPSRQKIYILVCTDYVTKWVEAKPLLVANEASVVTFTTDQGAQFTSRLVEQMMEKYKIRHRTSTPYHPQENGQVDSTNKVIEGILTKTVHLHRRYSVERLPEALWAYKTTWRNTT